jgi:starch synthase
METVKKFGWAPDIIHCHGWLTSLVPLYLKTAYKSEPLFQQVKTVYSVYNSHIDSKVSGTFKGKATINNLSEKELEAYYNGADLALHKGAGAFADAIIQGSETLDENAKLGMNYSDKPCLLQEGPLDLSKYMEFYRTLLGEEVSD